MILEPKAPFRRTTPFRRGKRSYHQVGAFNGQLMGYFNDNVTRFMQWFGSIGLDKQAGAELKIDSRELPAIRGDAVELGGWTLDLRRADTPVGATAYAKELVATAKAAGLEITSIAGHLQGQALGDRGSAKTLQFLGGHKHIIAEFEKWHAATPPPKDNPYAVSEAIAQLMREATAADFKAMGNLAVALGVEQDREVTVSGFVGSAGLWDEMFRFPPFPKNIGKVTFPNRIDQAYEVLAERFGPIFDYYKSIGVRFGLECHPGEIAMGDLKSAARFLDWAQKMGWGDVVGFNFDASHMLWQRVDPVKFLRTFGKYVVSAHHKGVWVSAESTDAGLLGGYTDFGEDGRGWEFVIAGCAEDCTHPEAILAELHRQGYGGAIIIELEDTRFNLLAATRQAVRNLRKIDLPPADVKFDAAFASA